MIKNSQKYSIKILFLIFFVSVLFSACGPARYMEKDEHLLVKVKVKIEDKDARKNIDKKNLLKYNKQKPLRKTFGYALYGRIYNIPNPKKDPKREKRKQEKIQKKLDEKEAEFNKKAARLLEEKIYNKKLYLHYLSLGDTALALEHDSISKQKEQEFYDYNNKRADEVVIDSLFFWYEWVRGIGEKPPVYDSVQAKKSAEQFKLYLRNKGYYNATITPKTKKRLLRRKRVKLIYHVYPGNPVEIGEVEYIIKDTTIASLLNKSDKMQIKVGENLDVEMLQKKRTEIAEYLKNNGYYYFSKEYINYRVDTIGRKNNAKLTLILSQFTDREGNTGDHPQFRIRDIYVFSDYSPNDALASPLHYFSDTIVAPYKFDDKTFYFVKKDRIVVKPQAIVNEIYIAKDSLYSFSVVKNTYNHLSKFQIYKLTNIQFSEVEGTDKNLLDCQIQLSPAKRQTYFFEIEGTNSSGNIGAATNIKHSHKNIFRGGEISELKLRVALESQNLLLKGTDSTSQFGFNTQEYGFEMKITFPRLLTPFKQENFIRKNNPKTILTSAFNYQDRPDYQKITVSTNFDYYWRSNKNTSHLLTPIKISSIRVPKMSDNFREYITETFLKDSYEDHFISGSSYNMVYTNQGIAKRNYVYIQLNGTLAGNSTIGLMALANADTIEGTYQIPYFNTLIAQFAKADIDFRFYQSLFFGHQVVLRTFAGVGLPYNNSKLLPFSEKYFAGGANGIRAWQVRSLGPGGYVRSAGVILPNQSADMKLEANFEYRLKFGKPELAFFVDAGNIWAINKYDNRRDALFKFDTFLDQVAVGSGVGFRYDISFLVARLDLGVKIRDPAAPEEFRFIPGSRPYYLQDFTLNFGIGYPF